MKALSKDYATPIQPDDEIAAIGDFLRATWDLESLQKREPEAGRSAIDSLVADVFMAGYNALSGVVDHYEASRQLHALMEAREEALAAQGGWGKEYPMHDGINAAYWVLYSSCSDRALSLSSTMNDAFDQNIHHFLDTLKTDYAGHEQLYPKGYPEFTQNYRDFKGMESFDEAAHAALFEGHDCASARSPDLAIRLSLPHVAYDDIGQGRPPEEMLLGRVFMQGMNIREYNNTVALTQELLAAANHDRPFATALDVPGPHQPMMQALWDLCQSKTVTGFEPLTEEKVESMRAAKAEFEALPPEEQKRRRAETLNAIIDEIKREEREP